MSKFYVCGLLLALNSRFGLRRAMESQGPQVVSRLHIFIRLLLCLHLASQHSPSLPILDADLLRTPMAPAEPTAQAKPPYNSPLLLSTLSSEASAPTVTLTMEAVIQRRTTWTSLPPGNLITRITAAGRCSMCDAQIHCGPYSSKEERQSGRVHQLGRSGAADGIQEDRRGATARGPKQTLL